ncbi:MAG: PEP-CTERM sorting domain-containing protein [Phycisphaerae bacterium]|nr:PEP-CTERM sorting domain-containing protein [Phycisphaerae bacterium]
MFRWIVSSFIVLACSASDVRASVAGNALYFDGVDDLVRIPDAPHLRFDNQQSFTIEGWFNLMGAINDGRKLISKRDSSTTVAMIDIRIDESGPVLAKYRDTAGVVEIIGGGSTVQMDNWYHFAVRKDADSDTWSMFINGDLKSTKPTLLGDMTPYADLLFGETEYPADVNFVGVMDEVRIWGSARTDSEIAQHYDQIIGDPHSQPDLVGYWNFDELPDDQQVLDSSSFEHFGSLGNTLVVGVDDPIRIVSTAPLVPEPSTALLFGVASIAALRRRR